MAGATMSSMAWFTAGVTVAVAEEEDDAVAEDERDGAADAEKVGSGEGVFGMHEDEPGAEFSYEGHGVQASLVPMPGCENELAGH